MKNMLFRPSWFRFDTDLGLLLLRLFVGALMLFAHGLPKLMGYAEKSLTFADPLGVGSHISLSLAIVAEVFCSIALILGVLTRFAAVPLLFTMLMAALVIHADDPWNKKEFALLYAVPFLTLLCTGAGRFSVDALLFQRSAAAAQHHR